MIATAAMEQTSIVACAASGYGKFARRSGRLEPRWVKSARSECLDHLIVFGEANLRRVLSAYVTYYNRWRPHRSLGQAAPCGEVMPPWQHACRTIAAAPVLDGLHHIYRAAA